MTTFHEPVAIPATVAAGDNPATRNGAPAASLSEVAHV